MKITVYHMIDILFLQPIVPHYRVPFFDGLSVVFNIRVLWGRIDGTMNINDSKKRRYIKKVRQVHIGPFVYTSIISMILEYKPRVVVTYGEVKELSNYILPLLRYFMGFRLVVWSQGIYSVSVTNFIRYILFGVSDGIMLYTEECYNMLRGEWLRRKACFINNAVLLTENTKRTWPKKDEENQRIMGVFVSRFVSSKKPDALLRIMVAAHAKNKRLHFNVIGSGPLKPDFSNLEYIHDYGALYGKERDQVLLKSDFLLMPYWVGLSVVEAFGFGLPIFTLKRRFGSVCHSVEYSYIRDKWNGRILPSIEALIDEMAHINMDMLADMGQNAILTTKESVNMQKMVRRASDFLRSQLLMSKAIID